MKKKTLETIRKLAKTLAPKHTFSYFTEEDLEQEIFLIALEALPRFDPQRSKLETFLYTHIRNRLINLKRNHFGYTPKPCCPECLTSPCDECREKKWIAHTKRRIIQSIPIDTLNDREEPNAQVDPHIPQNLLIEEALIIIEKRMPIELRADYLRLKSGIALAKNRRLKIEETIQNILEQYE